MSAVAQVSGLRRLASVPSGDAVLVYMAESEGDVFCFEFAPRDFKHGALKGRVAQRCLIGVRIVESARI